MTKYEFLRKMEEALSDEAEPSVVRENLKYYEEYIEEEVRKGRTEEEVLDELGDPWAIARTILDMKGTSGREGKKPQQRNVTEERQEHKEGQTSQIQGINPGCLVGVLVAVLVIFFIGSILVGIVRSIPFLIPILVVVVIVKILGGRS